MHRQSVRCPLNIWQADRPLSQPPVTSENMPPRHETVSKSASHWQLDTEGSCYRMICAVHHSPRWFCCLCPKRRKNCLDPQRLWAECHKKNKTGVISVLNCLIHIYNRREKKILVKAMSVFQLCHNAIISPLALYTCNYCISDIICTCMRHEGVTGDMDNCSFQIR